MSEQSECPRVVVIDDDPTFLTLLDDILGDAGYRAIGWRASHGAVERLRREQPAIIILDLWIEDADAGWRLLEAIRADHCLRHLPVIVCSAASTTLRERADDLARGEWRMLSKPFDLDDLLETIAALLPPAGCGYGALNAEEHLRTPTGPPHTAPRSSSERRAPGVRSA